MFKIWGGAGGPGQGSLSHATAMSLFLSCSGLDLIPDTWGFSGPLRPTSPDTDDILRVSERNSPGVLYSVVVVPRHCTATCAHHQKVGSQSEVSDVTDLGSGSADDVNLGRLTPHRQPHQLQVASKLHHIWT